MREKVIAGNWKMHNGTGEEAEALLKGLLAQVQVPQGTHVLVCPPFTALATAQQILAGSAIGLGAQDVFWKEKGAYTGQISAPMLRELGCTYTLVGHSERRGRFGVPEPDFDADILAYFGESDAVVNRKLRAAQAARLRVICCVGETLAERQAGQTDAIVQGQTTAALQGVSEGEAAQIIFAYEPVWAIGTGEVCAADEANRVCGVIRATVQALYGDAVAEALVVQYGGSVKPDNARELLSQSHIDGALVGGASLKAGDFAAIVAATG